MTRLRGEVVGDASQMPRADHRPRAVVLGAYAFRGSREGISGTLNEAGALNLNDGGGGHRSGRTSISMAAGVATLSNACPRVVMDFPGKGGGRIMPSGAPGGRDTRPLLMAQCLWPPAFGPPAYGSLLMALLLMAR